MNTPCTPTAPGLDGIFLFDKCASDVPQVKDPVDLLRAMHARIMSAVLPAWRHPALPACQPATVALLVSIIRSCAEGASAAAAVMMRARGLGAVPRAVFVPDPTLVQTIVEMGFSAGRAEEAIRRVGANSVEAAMEWLFMHPEEPGACGLDGLGARSKRATGLLRFCGHIVAYC